MVQMQGLGNIRADGVMQGPGGWSFTEALRLTLPCSVSVSLTWQRSDLWGVLTHKLIWITVGCGNVYLRDFSFYEGTSSHLLHDFF